jgi:hypothetical protein
MVTFGRVLLWTVVLLAPGGFLLLPLLAAHSLRARANGSGSPHLSLRERLTQLVEQARQSLSGLQRHWTKS